MKKIISIRGVIKMAAIIKDKFGFWENDADTRGFAACDHCRQDKVDRNPSGRTWQNGKITLCEAHLEEYQKRKGWKECRCGILTLHRRCTYCEADTEHYECNDDIIICNDCHNADMEAEQKRALLYTAATAEDW